MKLNLPYKFDPRPYQKEVFRSFFKEGIKRGILVWHRRAGKDKTAFNLLVGKAMERVGIYYYVFPEYAQGRKIFWDGIDKDGFKMRDHIPKELVKKESDQMMQIELVNGSIIQVIGTDKKIDNIVGTNPVGAIMSEYSIQNPLGWDFLRPIFKENGGWVLFVYTPRGKNHGFDLLEAVKNNDKWLVSVKSVEDTTDNDGNRIINQEAIDDERSEGTDEDLIQQEYYCSFDAAIKGAVFKDQIYKLRQEKRITKVPHEKALDVYTYWDLGRRDETAIWFVQFFGKEVRCIDYEEFRGGSLEGFVECIKNKRRDYGYNYACHNLPHDAAVEEMGIDMSRQRYLEKLGIGKTKLLPRPKTKSVKTDSAKKMFPNVWIDETNCKRGINCISDWHYKFDEKTRSYSVDPYHDRSSNGSDAFCYIGMDYDSKTTIKGGGNFTVNYDNYI